jgi:hypothetical protein
MSVDPRTIGEEILGAEIVAGKELTEVAGGVLETLERSAAIWLQQARWLGEDYSRFFRDSVSKPGDPASFFSLVESRSEHIASGFHQFGELIQKECLPATKIWTDFAGTVEQDWRSR